MIKIYKQLFAFQNLMMMKIIQFILSLVYVIYKNSQKLEHKIKFIGITKLKSSEE